MDEYKLKIVRNFINHVKNYDETPEGPITSATIEDCMNYSKRQFDRIFKNFSKHTPIEIAEKFRIIRCVEYISQGNSLKDAALQYGYTPEGLSNAIRTKLNLNVKKIHAGEFELKKYVLISEHMVQLDDYKYKLDKEIYMEIIESLNDEKFLKGITSKTREIQENEEVDIHFNFIRLSEILMQYDGCEIEKKTFEELTDRESILLYTIMKKKQDSGIAEFQMSMSEITSIIFILGFFINIDSLKLNQGRYILKLSDDIRMLLDGLKDIYEVTKECFDIILYSTFKGNTIILEFNDMYKEAMKMNYSLNKQ